MMATGDSACLRFRVGQEWYGVRVSYVVEVLHLVALNEPPVAGILGILTLRNMPVPVIDLREMFHIPSPTLQLDTPVIVVRQGEQVVGWLIDEADDVVTVPASTPVAWSDTCIRQAAQVNGQLLFLLEPESVNPEARS